MRGSPQTDAAIPNTGEIASSQAPRNDDGGLVGQLAEQVQNIFTPRNDDKINYAPIAEAVPREPQIVFQGGNIISLKQLGEVQILPLPQPIKDMALKFPRFAETLKKVAIKKPEDIKKLETAKLFFPGISETAGASQNIPISNFTYQQKANIPSNITFAKLGSKNIDLNINVEISNRGEPVQSISAIQNKPLYLAVKPDSPAKSVDGYFIFKSANSQPVSMLPRIATAALVTVQTVPEKQAQKDIVLQKFSYEDLDKDGIWTASINAPVADGKYEVRTVMNYQSPELLPKEISMIMVVDPEGYIFEKSIAGQELRIKNAIVSIYWLNPSAGSGQAKQYELWPAKDFQQQNPQKTDNTGRYSFLVPPGSYYLKVESTDYKTYQSGNFEVAEGSGVHQNIQLKPKNIWARIFSVERIMLAIIIILLIIIFIWILKKRS